LYLRGLGGIYIKKTREAVGSHVGKVSASVAVKKYIIGFISLEAEARGKSINAWLFQSKP
jgi:hypothetical protein